MIPRLVYGNSQAAADSMASYHKAAADRRRRRRFWRRMRRWAVRIAAALALLSAGVIAAYEWDGEPEISESPQPPAPVDSSQIHGLLL